MQLQTIIFIGRSGCGKGTQAKLLKEYISKNDTENREIFSLETGAKFREMIEGESYTSKLSKEIYNNGELQPAFLAVHIWSHILLEDLEENNHIVFDGTPRTYPEAVVLDSVMNFYKRQNPTIIFLNVSRDWSKKRLLERARFDDTTEEVEKRLNWFDKEVMPALNHLRDIGIYNFLDIDGERSIEDVQKEIIQKVFK